MTQLETSRLILRPWCDSDAQALYRWARDPEVGPSAGWAPHTSVENSREIIRTVLSEEGTFAVLLKGGDGGPIGSVGVFPTAIPVGKGEPEIGYWIAHPYWGQGLVPEAVEELLRWQFQEMGVQRVWCAHSPESAACSAPSNRVSIAAASARVMGFSSSNPFSVPRNRPRSHSICACASVSPG